MVQLNLSEEQNKQIVLIAERICASVWLAIDDELSELSEEVVGDREIFSIVTAVKVAAMMRAVAFDDFLARLDKTVTAKYSGGTFEQDLGAKLP